MGHQCLNEKLTFPCFLNRPKVLISGGNLQVGRETKRKNSGALVPGFTLFHQINQFQFLERFSAQEQGVGRSVTLDIVELMKLSHEQGEDFKRSSALLADASQHPNIVTLLRTAASVDGRPVLVFEESLDSFGQSLSDKVKERRAEVIIASKRVSNALSVAHQSGLTHGNIRPENIVSTKFGEPALANFILWPPSGGEQPLAEWLPDGFMPPEYLLGGEPSPASDQYGIAASIFYFLFGTPILTLAPGEPHGDFIARIVNEVPKKPHHGDLSSDLWGVFQRATDKDPTKRFPTIDSFHEAFSNVTKPPEVVAGSPWGPPTDLLSGLKILERGKETEERVLAVAPQPKVVVVRPARPVTPLASPAVSLTPRSAARSATLDLSALTIELTREELTSPAEIEAESMSEPKMTATVDASRPLGGNPRQHCSKGHVNHVGVRFCTTCGASFEGGMSPERREDATALAPSKLIAPGPLAIAPAKQPSTICACGRENMAGSSSCESCGRMISIDSAEEPLERVETVEEELAIEALAAIDAVPAPMAEIPTPAPQKAPEHVLCTNCNFENQSAVNFCRNCAKPLRSAGTKNDVVMIFDTTHVKD